MDLVVGDTPPELRDIAHYALTWGVSDDGYRADLIASTTVSARWNLKWVVDQFEETLEEWLAGPEAEGEAFSDAYIAFTSMVMASDEIDLGIKPTAH